MDEVEVLRNKALSLLQDPNQSPQGIADASELLRKAAEIENYNLNARKLRKELKEGRIVELVQLLAPYATVLILAATLAFQFSQQRQAAKDKAEDRDNALWADALKSVSEGQSLAALIKLKYFVSSEYHREDAHQLVLNLFRRQKLDDFKPLFENEFAPLRAENFNDALEINRILHDQWYLLYVRGENEPLQHETILELTYSCYQMVPMLKKRSPEQPLDLHSVAIFDCDFSYVDLKNANLTNLVTGRINLSHANLCGVTNWNNSDWHDTKWWQADSVDPKFRSYLEKNAPFKPDPADHYIPYPRSASSAASSPEADQDQYNQALQRLSSPPGNCS